METLAVAWDCIADLVMAAHRADRARYARTLKKLGDDKRTILAVTLLTRYCLRALVRTRVGREIEDADLTALAWELYPAVQRTMPQTTVAYLREALAMADLPADDDVSLTQIVWFIGHGGAALAALASDDADPLVGLPAADALKWVITKTDYEEMWSTLEPAGS